MTLEELYQAIGGDYTRALKVLRVQKLVDKHIRKLPSNPVFSALEQAGETMDASALFENAHAIKGVSANLGLMSIWDLSSKLSEEFRPGNERTMSDEQVKELVSDICSQFHNAADKITEYAASAG